MSDSEKIKVEEETTHEESHEEAAGEGKTWTEEIFVIGDQLLDTVKHLISEANVRRVVIRSNDGRNLLDVPVWLGIGGIALLPVYASIAVIALMATNCSIIVERAEKGPESA